MGEEMDNEIKEGKIYAMVSYWLFLCILPLLLKQENKFAIYHGKQGLVLFIFLVAAFVVSIIPIIGPIIWNTYLFVYLVVFVYGSFQSLKGNYFRLPFVSNLADKITI